MAAILSLLDILLELSIALRHLLLAELVTILFPFQDKEQIRLPVAFQTPRNLVLTRLDARIPKCGQLMRIAFAGQNGFDDGLPGHSADIAQHIRQLEISTWPGPVGENYSISPAGSGRSPFQDNARHHLHNRQNRSHAPSRAGTLQGICGLNCRARLCLGF